MRASRMRPPPTFCDKRSSHISILPGTSAIDAFDREAQLHEDTSGVRRLGRVDLQHDVTQIGNTQ